MKIGILTLPFNNNYGGYLQAYALMTVLKKMNHSVELINRRPKSWSLWRCTKYLLRNTGMILLRKPHRQFMPNPEKEIEYDGQLMLKFVDKHIIPRTMPIYSFKEMQQVIVGRYDAIVVGSDQVWRPEYVPNIEEFFLSFLPDESIKRVAYAASFGTNTPHYTQQEISVCSDNLMKFSAISVREEGGIGVIARMGWKPVTKPITVLDPTMLLSSKNYDLLLSSCSSESRKLVFCYVLDDTKDIRKIIEGASRLLHKDVRLFYGQNKWKNQRHVLPSIEDWLCNIRDSSFIITDSFHGAVFSIIYHKPFLVYVNKRRGADRMISLLDKFGLSNRAIFGSGTEDSVIYSQINWETVDEIWRNEYKKSIQFIEDSLQA